jgi:hypothetical protein
MKRLRRMRPSVLGINWKYIILRNTEAHLDMAEIEKNVLVNHGLSERVPTMQQMKKETEAWNVARNETAKKINWRFTTEDARIKLHRLYTLFE